MKTNLHLVFSGGKCTEAFEFYETVFGNKVAFKMTYGEAPMGMPIPEEAKALVMHMAMPLGSVVLMGCDAFPGRAGRPMGGFNISVELQDADEVKRIFTALNEGGSVEMPLAETFWSPLFGMCTDKFGVEWMVTVPGPAM
jgi:PhnB protein